MGISRSSGLALAVLLTGWALGCAPEDPGTSYFDLVTRLPETADTESSRKPVARTDRGPALFMPAGSRVEYLLEVEARSSLRADRIAFRGRVPLEIVLETDALGEQLLATLDRTQEGFVLPLSVDPRTPGRLVLRAAAGDAAEGVLLEAPALWSPSVPATQPAATGRPTAAPHANVIIYMIDTLRRDRLGCYGHPKAISPNLDRLAARSTLFLHSIGQSSWTKASTASVFTGTWPPTHGAVSWKHKLGPEAETLAEVLQAAGHRTAAFITNPNLVRHYGFDQGFDDFERHLKISSEEVDGLVFRWLDAHGAEGPFFLYIHTMDPHAPYFPREPYRTRFAPRIDEMPSWSPRWQWPLEALPFLREAYEAEIAENDAGLGRLVEELERRRLYDDTFLVVLSDHGEEFKEHGKWRHGNGLHAETLDVPLILKFPGQHEGHRVDTPVQHIDVMPTILEVLGLAVPDTVEGRSLAALAAGSTELPSLPIYSHVHLGRNPLSFSVVDGDWKLIRTQYDGVFTDRLYNWRQDAGETRDLSQEQPIRTAVLAAMLQRRARNETRSITEDEEPDAEVTEALEALGYLQ